MNKTSLLKSSTRAAAVLSAIAALSATSAHAQLYWDTNGTTTGAGSVANGTWDTATANWNTTADGSGTLSVFSTGSAAILSAGSDVTSASITLATTVEKNSGTVTFEEGSYALSGTKGLGFGTSLTVNAGAAVSSTTTFNVQTNSATLNVAGTLSGTSLTGGKVITKTGSGTATFATVDAALTINGGTIEAGGGPLDKIKTSSINSSGKLKLIGSNAILDTSTITVNSGGTFELASGVSDGIASLAGSGSVVGGANSALTLGASNANSTFTGTIAGGLNLIKAGTGTFTFGGASTSVGNITVNAGTFTLADAGSLTFYIGDNGISNSVGGTGTANFNGDFNFDFSGADLTNGNSWSIVSSSLSKSFGAGFGVNGFVDQGGGIWTNGGFTFDQSTGSLSYAAVPEPSTFAVLGGVVALGFAALRRRRAVRA